MRTLLVVGGGVESVPGIRLARQMGLFVVVSDGNPKAPGFAHANHAILANTYDEGQTLHEVRRFESEHRPLDGVISIAVDVPLTVATVASSLGLSGHSVETAHLGIDKLAMKDHLVAAGIPVPRYRGVASSTELGMVMRDWGPDLVVKPRDSRGARGVTRLSQSADSVWSFDEALAESPTGRVIVEEFLPGPQVSTESLLFDDHAVTPGFSDRNYELLEELAPYIIENGGEMPTRLSEQDRRSVTDVAVAAARALGVQRGTAKGDMVLTPDGPKVIEIAPRLSGGWFCTDQIPVATGVDLVGLAIRVALGEEIKPSELEPSRDLGVAIRYWFVKPGTVQSIEGLEDVEGIHWVHRLEMFVGIGQEVGPVRNHTQRAGCVICTGATRQEAVERAGTVIDAVRIRTA